MIMEKKYIRTEHPNLFEPNVYISMVVELDELNPVSPQTEKKTVQDSWRQRISDAVQTAYTKHEATMSRIVLEPDGTAYYKLQEKSGCKVFEDSRDDWRDILRENEKHPFELWNGELIRTYINTAAERSFLFIMAHHLVGDGKAVLIFIRDVLRILDGEKIAFQPMELVDDNKLRGSMHFPTLLQWMIDRINRKWERMGCVFTWEDYQRIHKEYWSTHTSEVGIKEYGKEELAQMKSQCPKNITLNSFLITQLAKEHPEWKSFGIPVSIREENASMCNQTSGIAIKYQYQKKRSFEENLKLVHKKIQNMIQNATKKYFILVYMAAFAPTLIDAVLMESQNCYHNPIAAKLAKSMGYLGRGYTDCGVTNLGRINIPSEYSGFKVKNILFLPSKVSYANEIIGIGTFDGRLSMIHRLRK